MHTDLALKDEGEVIADVADLEEGLALVNVVVFEVLATKINNLRLLLIKQQFFKEFRL